MDRAERNKIRQFFNLLRYRFFLTAGILPYILGASASCHSLNIFHWNYFLIGLIGIGFSLVAVETFNEYFDAKVGTDRIFQQGPLPKIPEYILAIGIGAFGAAFLLGLYLTIARGLPVMLFAIFGFLAAAFYVGPPLRWAYRGLGEAVIFLSYGPFMTLGSYYLQAQRIDSVGIFAGLLGGVLIFSLAIINEVPDFYQDRLVGKRNLVVRFGKKSAVSIYGAALIVSFGLIALGVALRVFPALYLFAFFALPVAFRNVSIAKKHFEEPEKFIPAIRGSIILYLVLTISLVIFYLIS